MPYPAYRRIRRPAVESINNRWLETWLNEYVVRFDYDTNAIVVPDGEDLFQDWTPTYANLTVGNGTVVARYAHIGSLVYCWYELTFGSTSAISGDVTVSLPVAPSASYSSNENTVGHALFRDATGSRLTGVAHISTGSVVRLRVNNSGGTYLSESALSATIPFTWTTSDVLYWQAVYETA